MFIQLVYLLKIAPRPPQPYLNQPPQPYLHLLNISTNYSNITIFFCQVITLIINSSTTLLPTRPPYTFRLPMISTTTIFDASFSTLSNVCGRTSVLRPITTANNYINIIYLHHLQLLLPSSMVTLILSFNTP